jgi:hypothetical protein
LVYLADQPPAEWWQIHKLFTQPYDRSGVVRSAGRRRDLSIMYWFQLDVAKCDDTELCQLQTSASYRSWW